MDRIGYKEDAKRGEIEKILFREEPKKIQVETLPQELDNFDDLSSRVRGLAQEINSNTLNVDSKEVLMKKIKLMAPA